ncbi:helicase [Stygiomarasmius scandens]|uniref:Helicase n=1 Tax=Marasmiellus scandens TaxID=2682957 RepID=A0ABR1K905_9AGAR
MPPFQPLTLKRRHGNDDLPASKRQNLDGDHSSGVGNDRYWMVQWRNPQYKKHVTWEGDAVLVAISSGSKSTLYDSDGKQLTSGKLEPLGIFEEGREATLGGKHVMFDREITKDEYLSGTCFGVFSVTSPTLRGTDAPKKSFAPPRLNVNAPRPPTLPLSKPTPLQPSNSVAKPDLPVTTGISKNSCWTANWRKPAGNKKQAHWEGDAFVLQVDNKITAVTEEGKTMGSTSWKGAALESSNTIHVGGKELLLLSEISTRQLPTSIQKNLGLHITFDETAATETSNVDVNPSAPSNKYVPPTSLHGNVSHASKKIARPLHDPEAEGAIVMKSPTKEHMEKHNKKNRPVVPVVIDPIITRRLRPHQQEGVKFMYECVMGLRRCEGYGCILADEMGLGKTLQTIALIWTLLKQNPYFGIGPVINKVLIVCPVSLINNWKAEFHKWLGRDRLGVSACDKDVTVVKTFANSQRQHVLIVGYERLRTIIKEIDACGIGLIVCDEGHRLKSSKSKTNTVFQALHTPRRVILSGTPIQNDLGEFHAMVDFCNPNLLDEYANFRRIYEVPILKSRAPDCTAKEAELGESRSARLANIVKDFVLRRAATILGNHLPPKHEYVVFITPTPLQLSIFAKILQADQVDDLVYGSTAESLALITLLTKVSSSPILLKATLDKARAEGTSTIRHRKIHEAATLLPERAEIDDMSLSGKLSALAKLLAAIKADTDEKCVLVSHYTSTLNILESFCKKMGYSYYRLDGQTPATKRQEYVNNFNKSSQQSSYLFLLSSKAGGIGINLIGASRLCLIDSDWNPSHDLQAMARCYRDGQKRPVFIYRFLTAGTIDEKIYQRQIIKLGLSNSLMESDKVGSKGDSFTKKDLRDIFRINLDTACNTHDLLECICDNPSAGQMEDSARMASDEDDEDEDPKGFIAASQVKPGVLTKTDREYLKKKKESLAALAEWRHINCLKKEANEEVQDLILRKLLHSRESKSSCNESTNQTQLQRILAAVDMDAIAELDGLSVRDVPGGTISFLFQKSSFTPETVREDGLEDTD